MDGWMNILRFYSNLIAKCHHSCLKGQGTMLRWALFALFIGICASARDDKKKKVEPQPFSRGGWPTFFFKNAQL